jgi:uncharacterized metal-binding protein
MKLKLLRETTLDTLRSHHIISAVLKGVAIYFVLAFIFGTLYYSFDALEVQVSTSSKTFSFLDYIYFSAITFTTIGYGDIIPKEGAGQIIAFIESCFALTFIPVFGGFLAYKFLQRPNDLLLTDNFFIRYRNQRIALSLRVGNKGKILLDCNATIELLQIENNEKRTLYKRELNVPMVERTWYLEMRLDGEDNVSALQQFKILMKKPETSLIRTTITGYDSTSGNLVHIFKYYTMDKLLFGGKFSDVYIWEGVERSQPDWTNFNKILSITSTEQQYIDELLR